MTKSKKVRVSLDIEMSGTVTVEMDEEEWRELDSKLEDNKRVRVDEVSLNWSDVVNGLDGFVEDAAVDES